MSVELLKNTARAYISENLEKLFQENGFTIDRNFFITNNGHQTSKLFYPPHVGIIGTLKTF